MFSQKVPLYLLILTAICSGAGVYFFNTLQLQHHQESTIEQTTVSNNCEYKLKRLDGYSYIHPLMYAEPANESAELSDVKATIEQIINEKKQSGIINDASVYLREFNKANWISINPNAKFAPGSLLKVPELFAFLKMEEQHPGTLNKKITYSNSLTSDKNPTFLSNSIKIGQTYTIKELLKYMITYSDNNATILLNQQVDKAIFNKVFADMGITPPDPHASQFPLTAKEYSLFMKVLYNASYLSIAESEFCSELLSTCDFKKGLVAGLPAGTKIVHKFGEGGTNNLHSLSESGIIFINNNAYIITVMTSGADLQKLPEVIATISKRSFELMNSKLGSLSVN